MLTVFWFSVLGDMPASAQEPIRAAGAAVYDERHWALGIPVWIPGYRGEFAIGDITIDGETSGGSGFFERFFDSELRINYFFMGSAAYRRDRWRFHGEIFGGKFTSDVIFKLTNGTVVSASVQPTVPRVVAEYRAREYNLGQPGQWTVQIWALAGVRYYDVAVEAAVASRLLQADKGWADPIVGRSENSRPTHPYPACASYLPRAQDRPVRQGGESPFARAAGEPT